MEVNLSLNSVEETLIQGLQAKERENNLSNQRLQEAFQVVAKGVEKRLGLAEGAVGSEYHIDLSQMKLVQVLVKASPEKATPRETDLV